MRTYRINLVWLSVVLISIITVIAFISYKHLLDSMSESQKSVFIEKAIAKTKSVNLRTETFTKQLQSYTQIPAFSEIHYHTLTRNTAVVRENIRSLELYFFSLHKDNQVFLSISLINNDGKEKIRIDNGQIQSNHRDFSATKNFQELQSKNNFVTLNSENETIKSINWWVPIYPSSSKRLGFLVFELDFALFQELIDTKNSDEDIYLELLDKNNNTLFQGSENISDDSSWVIEQDLSLPELGWKIKITANTESLLAQINRVKNIVNYIAIPLVIILVIGLLILAVRHRKVELNIQHMAFHDMLTGLVNRHEFEYRIDKVIENKRRKDSEHAVLYMDLDHFKLVNDTAGHLAGDELLRQLSIRLKQLVRETDTLARLGGDEFGLLLENCNLEQAEAIAHKISIMMQEFKFSWEGKTYDVGMSIGVVLFDRKTVNHDEVLRHADIACYQAKDLGRNRIEIYSLENEEIAQRHGEMQWVQRIKTGLEEDNFLLFCQPILGLNNSDSSLNWEVLVRLNENGHMALPNSFIPSAERFGMMPRIDRWVVESALSNLEKLYKKNTSKQVYRFFINVSGTSLSDPKFLNFLRETLAQKSVPKDAICFEITETAAITNLTEVINFIEEIKPLGCKFALDDFGAGLSSFSYLKMLPIDYLKIDGSFVQSMLDDELSYKIVDVINQIGQATKIKTIAEFVTKQSTLTELQKLGIDYAQGYGIKEPFTIHDLINPELRENLKKPLN